VSLFKDFKTLIILTLAQSFGQTAAPILVLLGGIVGTRIAPSPDLATLPIAVQVIGIASATIPASLLMSRVGRRAGFLTATLLAIFASLLAARAIYLESFGLFVGSCFLIGNYIAFLQQFRFAVAESVPVELVPKCLSFLMLSGIVAALLGPEVGRRFSAVEGLPQYVGSFLGLAVMLSISFIILMLFYRNPRIPQQDPDVSTRRVASLLGDPRIILAIAAAAMAYSIMALIMTATPLSMHELDGHSLENTTRVLQSHILAMYIPSFFSGVLISRLGVMRIIKAGLVLMFICVLIGWGEPQFFDYFGALLFLGVGWNFLFLGGTTLLAQSYRSSERFKVQAINDFTVFGLQAIGSLSAGLLLATIGWLGVMAFALPALVVLLSAIFLTGRAVVQGVTQ